MWLKDLRYLWRAPVQRANIVTGVVTAGFVTVPLLTGTNRASDLVPYVGAVVAFFLETNLSANLFGVDGAGFGAYLLTGADAGQVLRGKALAVTTVVADDRHGRHRRRLRRVGSLGRSSRAPSCSPPG